MTAARPITAGRRGRRGVIGALLLRRLSRPAGGFIAVTVLTAAVVDRFEAGAAGSTIHGYGDALWMCLVTLSTVGYGDRVPVTTGGHLATGAFILFTLVTLGFLLAAVNESVLEVQRMDDMGLLGTSMVRHVIVYGFGPVAQTAIAELVAAGRPVAVLCELADDIPQVRRLGPADRLYVTSGEMTQDLLRNLLNVPAAETAVIAGADDARNIVAALNVRAVRPTMRVIVSVRSSELRQTLIASGVTYVASPFELGGRLVASAAFEPEVAQFVEDITSALSGCDLQQFPAQPFAGRTIADVRGELQSIGGPLLVGVARSVDGHLDVLPNPPNELLLAGADHIIVLGDHDQAVRVTRRWKVNQGR